jgi:hypothetical protein
VGVASREDDAFAEERAEHFVNGSGHLPASITERGSDFDGISDYTH